MAQSEILEVTKKLEDGRFFCLHNHIKVNMNNFLFIYIYKRIIIIHRYPIYIIEHYYPLDRAEYQAFDFVGLKCSIYVLK